MKKSPGRKALRQKMRSNRREEGRKKASANELKQKLEARMRPVRWRIKAKMRIAARRTRATPTQSAENT